MIHSDSWNHAETFVMIFDCDKQSGDGGVFHICCIVCYKQDISAFSLAASFHGLVDHSVCRVCFEISAGMCLNSDC